MTANGQTARALRAVLAAAALACSTPPARAEAARAAGTGLAGRAEQAGARQQGGRRQSRRPRERSAAKVTKSRPDVIYVPTPPETVDEMLRLARLKPGDVLYDLGSGDGRIPIAAARQYGVAAVGIEIDPKLVEEARESARREGVSDLATFRHADMFRTDFREATVVTLYLSDRLNLLLRPKLLAELRPGARIVSHDFRMGDWKPEREVRVPWKGLYRTVYVWTVPAGRGAAAR